MELQKSCGAVVFALGDNHISFLTVQSRDDGHWGFPKGHSEKGESDRETALREICEETGLKVSIVEGFREEIKYVVNNNIDKTVVYFLAEAEQMEVMCQEEEIKSYKWEGAGECLETLSYDSLKEVLKKALKWMESNNIM